MPRIVSHPAHDRPTTKGVVLRTAPSDRHIATGLEYLPAVARRLHHGRDLGEPFDFLTWFEFAPEHAAAFEDWCGGCERSKSGPTSNARSTSASPGKPHYPAVPDDAMPRRARLKNRDTLASEDWNPRSTRRSTGDPAAAGRNHAGCLFVLNTCPVTPNAAAHPSSTRRQRRPVAYRAPERPRTGRSSGSHS